MRLSARHHDHSGRGGDNMLGSAIDTISGPREMVFRCLTSALGNIG